MKTKIITVALLFYFAAMVQADQSKSMSRQQFVDFIGQKSVTAMCDRDPRLKKCMKFTAEQCEAVVTKVTPGCQNILLQNMPDTVSKKEDFVKYGILFSQCAGTKMIEESGIDINEINQCFKS